MKKYLQRAILTPLLLLLLFTSKNYAQKIHAGLDSTINITLYFESNSSVIDLDYMDNRSYLSNLVKIIHADTNIINNLRSIFISSYASPDGDYDKNILLATRRATSAKRLLQNSFPSVATDRVSVTTIEENWGEFRELIAQSDKIPYKAEVLEIIDSDINLAVKKWRLKQVGKGASWRYITGNFLSGLRSITFKFGLPQNQIEPITLTFKENYNISSPDKILDIVEVKKEDSYSRPIAFKTNLLFDLATILNIELEVPIAKRFSVAGEWIFPWWQWENKQNALELLSYSLEFRYWFNPNFKHQDKTLGKHNPLSGWFIGLYGGGGQYDLEYNRKGYQDKSFTHMGISGGYVLPLSRGFSMEFSLGLGYLKTDYKYYNARYSEVDSNWHLIRQYNGSYSWFGPTKAKISLIWYPHFKKRGDN